MKTEQEYEERCCDFVAMLTPLGEESLKKLCWIFECYPNYGDQSVHGLACALWSKFREQRQGAARCVEIIKMVAALKVLL
jgi:hypothetical protein